MPHDAEILGLKGYEIKDIHRDGRKMTIQARYTGPVSCPQCGCERLRKKDKFIRKLRYETWGVRHCYLHLEALRVNTINGGTCPTKLQRSRNPDFT